MTQPMYSDRYRREERARARRQEAVYVKEVRARRRKLSPLERQLEAALAKADRRVAAGRARVSG
jgi:hypothetical protein